MKKLAIAFAVLINGISAFAINAMPTPSYFNNNVTVPILPAGFYVGASLFYFQPSVTDGDLNFAVDNNTADTREIAVRPGFDWGWATIQAGYIFEGTSNDVSIDYWHLGTLDKRTVSGNVTDLLIPLTATSTDINLSNFVLQPNLINSRPGFDFNQVDLEVGQYINLGSRWQFHPMAGLQYSRINQRIDSQSFLSLNLLANDVGATGPFTVPVNTISALNSTFNGIGPRLELNANYNAGYGFGVEGQFSTAVLVGRFTSTFHTFISSPGGVFSFLIGDLIQPFIIEDSVSVKTWRVVTNLQGKLGVNYTYLFKNDCVSSLKVALGYQVDKYFNSLDVIRTSGNLNRPQRNFETTTVPAITFTPGQTIHEGADFGFHGPYVSLTFNF
jgi:hypothetical protein